MSKTTVSFTFPVHVDAGASINDLQKIWHAMADVALESDVVDSVDIPESAIEINPDDSCGAV